MRDLRMRLRLVWQVAGVGLAAGCAADGRPLQQQVIPDYNHFAHTAAGPHVTLYWDCVRTDSGVLRLEGIGLNRWEPIPPRFLEFVLSQVDAQGRVLASTRGAARGVDLLQGFPAPFRLEFKEQEGAARLDLVYQHQYVDDSFDRLSRRLPSYVTRQIRDACGKDAHRNRP
jgi:hypothetical protein